LNRQWNLILVLAAMACFAVTALIPFGQKGLSVEMVARSPGESGPGTVLWTEAGSDVAEMESLPLVSLDKHFKLIRTDLPTAKPDRVVLILKPVDRERDTFLLTDLRISCRHGPFNRLWSIDPGSLEPSEGLAIRQVKPGLWLCSAPRGVPRIKIDLSQYESVDFLRSEIGAWLLFWTMLVLLVPRPNHTRSHRTGG